MTKEELSKYSLAKLNAMLDKAIQDSHLKFLKQLPLFMRKKRRLFRG